MSVSRAPKDDEPAPEEGQNPGSIELAASKERGAAPGADEDPGGVAPPIPGAAATGPGDSENGAGGATEAVGRAWSRAQASRRRRGDLQESLWIKCPTCGKLIYKPRMEEMLFVCPECNFHFEIPGPTRVLTLVDSGSFDERFSNLEPLDPLSFVARKAYKDRLVAAQKLTGLKDACVIGTARMEEIPVVFGVSDSRFLRGSMGSVVGEKICRGIELAGERRCPFVFVSGSGGGARMDEGILSLMQMAKTAAALKRLAEHQLPYISILADPTTGGVSASFAFLGDVLIAEPGALIGFAGPRVIEQTIRQKLPEGFQRAEFLLEHGLIDQVVHRKDLRNRLDHLLSHMRNTPILQADKE